MSKRYFHFTMGPVQGFVAQARRTKDFWAGSFLLSFLSGVAMVATQNQKGKILFPLPDEAYLKAIQGIGDFRPRQGNIPNRFKAEVDEDFSPQTVLDAVQNAWNAIAQTVWDNDLRHLAQSPTHAIFWRQIHAFWEMTWAMSLDEKASDLLDRRKNWRTHTLSEEAGLKCSIMEGLQELSGVQIAQSHEQREFWTKLRKKGFDLDLGEGERLSAIAFVKRRFVGYFDKLEANIGVGKIYGWKLSTNVPSVALLAATPWLASVAKHPKIDDLIEAAEALGAREAPVTQIKLLRESGNPRLLRLDGMALFDTMLENKNLYENTEHVNAMKKALKPLYKENIPTPFYAILMMDGDSLGAQMSDAQKQPIISKALGQFTQGVEKIVDDYSGFLIYAGGDDVLAILPLESALDCAATLRAHYEACFTQNGKKTVPTTISAAIIYSHIKNPLHSVLHHIHTLLDDVAKEATGRDAIALQVLKPGGIQQTWSQKWDIALQDGVMALGKLAHEYQQQTEQGNYSSGFFYRIRELMKLTEGIEVRDAKIKLLAVEYRAGTRLSQKEAEKIIEPLLKQCTYGDATIHADGALIVRFLAQKGVRS